MSSYKKTSLWICLAGAGLLSVAGSARAGGPAEVDIGFHCNFAHGGVRATFGPWYAYFPYEAHFQLPAPVGLYPNWPVAFPPVAPPAVFPPMPAPVPAPAEPRRTAPAQSSIQPVGYYQYGYGYYTPSYWYNR